MAKIAKPRRPRSVTILGVKVKIVYTKKILYDGDEELMGTFNADDMTIHVFNNDHAHETLCHELFHSFLHLSGYNQGMPLKTEEGLTVSFENCFAKYLRF